MLFVSSSFLALVVCYFLEVLRSYQEIFLWVKINIFISKAEEIDLAHIYLFLSNIFNGSSKADITEIYIAQTCL